MRLPLYSCDERHGAVYCFGTANPAPAAIADGPKHDGSVSGPLVAASAAAAAAAAADSPATQQPAVAGAVAVAVVTQSWK